MSFAAKIEAYVRRHGMIAPGDRVGVAVSGGADSVALLRALYELRGELGCVLAVVHFNHKIRPEADADAAFVESMARDLGLELFRGSGDAKQFASQNRMSLETAARELRYGFFSMLAVDKIATAHTLDDQAETVLMKVLRGAGTRGLSGIWPIVRRQGAGSRGQERRTAEGGCATQIIRPMLGVSRKEVEAYLRALGQEWREDASNRDVKHTRNKVRHELLPLLEREYNPNIYQQLADAAEVARGEEEYWAEVIKRQEAGGRRQEIPRRGPSTPLRSARDDNQTQGPPTRAVRSLGMTNVEDSNWSETPPAASLRVDHLLNEPLAVRRRAVREAFERVSGKSLDFEHTDALVRFLERRESSLLQLPERWFAVLDWPKRCVSFEERASVRNAGTGVGRKPSKARGEGGRRQKAGKAKA